MDKVTDAMAAGNGNPMQMTLSISILACPIMKRTVIMDSTVTVPLIIL